jgi:hypothetical protein
MVRMQRFTPEGTADAVAVDPDEIAMILHGRRRLNHGGWCDVSVLTLKSGKEVVVWGTVER